MDESLPSDVHAEGWGQPRVCFCETGTLLSEARKLPSSSTEKSLYFPPPVSKGQAAQQEVASFSLLNGFNVMSRNVPLEQQDGSTAYDAQTPG